MQPNYYYADPQPTEPPPVWVWYLVYATCMALLYVAIVVGGIWFALDTPSGESPLLGAAMALISFPLAIAFGVAAFLPKKSWVWYYHAALIGLGMTSACCLPACGALIYFWLKPETKAFFGVT